MSLIESLGVNQFLSTRLVNATINAASSETYLSYALRIVSKLIATKALHIINADVFCVEIGSKC